MARQGSYLCQSRKISMLMETHNQGTTCIYHASKNQQGNQTTTYYLQSNPIVVFDPTISLCSFLSFSFFLQIEVNAKVLQEFSKNNLSVQEYEIMNERANTELIKTQLKKVVNWFSKAFLSLMPLFSSFSFIFPLISLARKFVYFHLPILLYFHKQMSIIASFHFPMPLPISIAIS